MKRILLLSIISLISYSTCIYAQTFKYASPFSGFFSINSGQIFINDLQVDNAGDVVSVGSFSEVIDFDPTYALNMLTAIDGYDIFLQKNDNKGNPVWVKTIGHVPPTAGVESFETGLSLAVDASNNIYMVGVSYNDIDIDPGAGTFMITDTTFFVAKYNDTGGFVWGKTLPPPNGSYRNNLIDADIAIDKTGDNIYVAYYYRMNVNTLKAIYIEKISTSGTSVWKTDISTSGLRNGNGYSYLSSPHIAVDRNNNVYISSIYRGDVRFNAASTTVDTADVGTIFLVKLNSAGSFVYLKEVSGSKDNLCYDMALDNNDNPLLVGAFSGVTDFDPGSATHNVTSSNSNGRDIYILKLTPAGNYVWVKTFGNNGYNSANGVATDPANNIYVTGSLLDIEFSKNPPVQFQVKVPGPSRLDGFILKLSHTGNYMFAQQFIGTELKVQGNSVAINKTGTEFFVSGSYADGIDFDTTKNGALAYTGQGSFIAKFDSCSPIDLTVTNIAGTISANATNVSCQWIDCAANTPVAGANGKSFTPASSGSYAAILTNGMCVDTTACTYVQAVTVDNIEPVQAHMYPNPAKDMLYLSFAKVHREVELTISAISGQIVARSTYLNTNAIEKVISFPAGLYYVTIATEEGTTVKKLVVVR